MYYELKKIRYMLKISNEKICQTFSIGIDDEALLFFMCARFI